MKSCLNCHFAYTHDVGYSNYTVEGTNFCCFRDLNPDLPTSYESYEDNENNSIYQYAEECDEYLPGGPSADYAVEDDVNSEDF